MIDILNKLLRTVMSWYRHIAIPLDPLRKSCYSILVSILSAHSIGNPLPTAEEWYSYQVSPECTTRHAFDKSLSSTLQSLHSFWDLPLLFIYDYLIHLQLSDDREINNGSRPINPINPPKYYHISIIYIYTYGYYCL